MFSSLTNQLRQEVDGIKAVLSTNDRIRNLVFPITPPNAHEATASSATVSFPASVVSPGLTRLDWQIFDHCAAFTRLYAIYEQFITDIITEYLQTLPELYPSYSELPNQCKMQHRIAVGQILQKWSEDGPYGELTAVAIIEGLADGLAGKPSYTLLPEAFLIDQQNYRAEILRRLFTYLGFDDCLTFVRRFPLMVEFMNSNRDSTETVQTILHDFVENRNEASHASVTDTVALSGILSLADFIVILCHALAELLNRRVLRRRLDLGQLVRVGQVIHRYRNNISGVRAAGGLVTVGESLVAATSRTAFGVALISIQSGDVPLEFISLHPNQEIGLGLDHPLNVGIELYRRPPPTN